MPGSVGGGYIFEGQTESTSKFAAIVKPARRILTCDVIVFWQYILRSIWFELADCPEVL